MTGVEGVEDMIEVEDTTGIKGMKSAVRKERSVSEERTPLIDLEKTLISSFQTASPAPRGHSTGMYFRRRLGDRPLCLPSL